MRTVFNFIRSGLAVVAAVTMGCGDDGGGDGGLTDAEPVIQQYAANVRAGYSDSLTEAMNLQAAVDAFVAGPSQNTLEAARDSWKAAREPYGLTEVFRFYDGPIDDPETGPEGQMNAWPLDENYIDYVEGNPSAGLINDTTFTITAEALADKNEQGGEKNIATGYHAIEFLLWGQDTNPDGPGDRPFSDYQDGGAHPNFDRRKLYLTTVTQMLVDDLQLVVDAWAEGGGNYRADFEATAPTEALRRILLGMGSLAGAELSGERMTTALDNMDQEDEHSCFSDNTHRDLRANALAVENAYLGRFGTTDGPGVDDLVEARDPALNAKLKMQLAATNDAIAAIPAPFDQAIQDATKRELVLTAIRALQAETETIVQVGELLGIQINIE